MIEFLLIIIAVILTAIFLQLIQIKRKVHRIMAATETLAEYVQQIDAETTRIAEFIESNLNKEGVTVEQLQASLTPVVDKLKLVGSTPPVNP